MLDGLELRGDPEHVREDGPATAGELIETL